MPRVKIIDDATIRQLMKTSLAVQSFPFLQAPPKLLPKQSCCGKKSQVNYDFNSIKATIAHLSESEQKKLLGILGWPAARVVYQAGTALNEVVIRS